MREVWVQLRNPRLFLAIQECTSTFWLDILDQEDVGKELFLIFLYIHLQLFQKI